MKCVGIFEHDLISNFVLNQVAAMRRFMPLLLGCRSNYAGACPSYVVNRGNWGSRLSEYELKIVRRVPAAFRSLSPTPSLLHAHFGPNGLLILPLAQHLGIPLVTTFHGFDATMTRGPAAGWMHRLYRWRKAELIAHGTLFICVSRFIQKCLLAQGFPRDRLRVHYIGVDTGFFTPSLRERHDVVLCVARLVSVKRIDLLIDAMARIQRSRPDIALCVVGDGPLRHELEGLASAKLRNYKFLGWCPPHEVRDVMQTARALCLPSLNDKSGYTEALGLSLLEAQACGTPVVAFDRGGVGETMLPGVTGFLVEPKRDDALADALMMVFDEDNWSFMSREAARFVSRNFDLTKQTAELEDIYADTIAAS